MSHRRDKHGVLCMSAQRFIKTIIDEYKQHFGEIPKEVSSPIEHGTHPELDTSEFVGSVGIRRHQSIVGSLQWAVTIGRFDIAPAVYTLSAVNTLSAFRAALRKGQLEVAKRVVGYLYKMIHAHISVRVNCTNYSDIPKPNYNWIESTYGKVKEVIPKDAPKAYGPLLVYTV